MNDQERTRILGMVAEGVISPEEGADLLEALRDEARASQPASFAAPTAPPPTLPARSRRTLVIQVRDGTGENGTPVNRVDIRIPFGLAKAASKFIPRQAHQILAEHDIDLKEFIDEFIDSQEAGPLVQVTDGPSHVLIAVE